LPMIAIWTANFRVYHKQLMIDVSIADDRNPRTGDGMERWEKRQFERERERRRWERKTENWGARERRKSAEEKGRRGGREQNRRDENKENESAKEGRDKGNETDGLKPEKPWPPRISQIAHALLIQFELSIIIRL